jgi:dTDP-4-dehydrorhamnose reductase
VAACPRYTGTAGTSIRRAGQRSMPTSSRFDGRPLMLWGGHECTLNRVGDRYSDQSELSGYIDRADDIEAFAELGLQSLRYPVLWEKFSSCAEETGAWAWHDARLAALRARGVAPIIGLVHHGSGPPHTDLLDDGFAPGLARHAAGVAARYPWVEAWTPVNEPVTTARFSALYGHWYPHRRDERSFWAALLNQIDGVVGAMRAIRLVIPGARLVQTEDLGRTYATDPLAPQAAFDNERRWAGWDLLCGRLLPGHPLWQRLVDFGFEHRLRRLADAPCAPDIVGINHYLTSDRFLDHRTELYPAAAHGICPFGRLADVEAIRAVVPAPGGIAGALREAWDRYQRPLALTEVHLGCTREDQLRWFDEAWTTAMSLRAEGIDVVAVTAWSLLGAYNWASLLTRSDGTYESGAFDVSAGHRRDTALARLIRELATGHHPSEPLLARSGWWRGAARLAYPPYPIRQGTAPSASRDPDTQCPPLLILGATGTLGQAFAGACRLRNIPYVVTSRQEMSLDDAASLAANLDRAKPWAVINATGWVRVDDAEMDPAGCRAANRDGPLRLAAACAARGIALTSFSSDLVFDGMLDRAYREQDATAPLSVYGQSKAEADAALLAMDAQMLVIRTASFFSPYDPHNFAMQVVAALRSGNSFRAADDVVTSPTYVPDLVRTTLDLLIDRETGLWHLASDGALSWGDFAKRVALAAALDPAMIEAVPAVSLGWTARRPRRVALASSRSGTMPKLDDAIGRFAAAL